MMYKPELKVDNKPLVDKPVRKDVRVALYHYFHSKQDIEAYRKAFNIELKLE